MAKTVCPECHNNDQIFKLPAIVEQGTRKSTSIGVGVGLGRAGGMTGGAGGIGLGGSEDITGLATLLSPAPPPAKPRGFGCGGITLGLLLTFAAFFVGALLVMPSMKGQTLGNTSFGEVIPSFLKMALPAIVVGFIFVVLHIRLKNKQQAKYEDELYPKYEAYLNVWQRCYYCARDHIVFDPIQNLVLTPEEVKDIDTLLPNFKPALEAA
jgi:hypothetical protein